MVETQRTVIVDGVEKTFILPTIFGTTSEERKIIEERFNKGVDSLAGTRFQDPQGAEKRLNEFIGAGISAVEKKRSSRTATIKRIEQAEIQEATKKAEIKKAVKIDIPIIKKPEIKILTKQQQADILKTRISPFTQTRQQDIIEQNLITQGIITDRTKERTRTAINIINNLDTRKPVNVLNTSQQKAIDNLVLNVISENQDKFSGYINILKADAVKGSSFAADTLNKLVKEQATSGKISDSTADLFKKDMINAAVQKAFKGELSEKDQRIFGIKNFDFAVNKKEAERKAKEFQDRFKFESYNDFKQKYLEFTIAQKKDFIITERLDQTFSEFSKTEPTRKITLEDKPIQRGILSAAVIIVAPKETVLGIKDLAKRFVESPKKTVTDFVDFAKNNPEYFLASLVGDVLLGKIGSKGINKTKLSINRLNPYLLPDIWDFNKVSRLKEVHVQDLNRIRKQINNSKGIQKRVLQLKAKKLDNNLKFINKQLNDVDRIYSRVFNPVIESTKLANKQGKKINLVHVTNAKIKQLFGGTITTVEEKALKQLQEFLKTKSITKIKEGKLTELTPGSKTAVSIEKFIEESNGVIGGAKSQNVQVGSRFRRITTDYDVYVTNPKTKAINLAKKLSEETGKTFVAKKGKKAWSVLELPKFQIEIGTKGVFKAKQWVDFVDKKIIKGNRIVKIGKKKYLGIEHLAEAKLLPKGQLKKVLTNKLTEKELLDAKLISEGKLKKFEVLKKRKIPKNVLEVQGVKGIGKDRLRFSENFLFLDLDAALGYSKALKPVIVRVKKIKISKFNKPLQSRIRKASKGLLTEKQMDVLRRALVKEVNKNPNKVFAGTRTLSKYLGEREFVFATGTKLKRVKNLRTKVNKLFGKEVGSNFAFSREAEKFIEVVDVVLEKQNKLKKPSSKKRIIKTLKDYQKKYIDDPRLGKLSLKQDLKDFATKLDDLLTLEKKEAEKIRRGSILKQTKKATEETGKKAVKEEVITRRQATKKSKIETPRLRREEEIRRTETPRKSSTRKPSVRKVDRRIKPERKIPNIIRREEIKRNDITPTRQPPRRPERDQPERRPPTKPRRPERRPPTKPRRPERRPPTPIRRRPPTKERKIITAPISQKTKEEKITTKKTELILTVKKADTFTLFDIAIRGTPLFKTMKKQNIKVLRIQEIKIRRK